MRIVILSVFLLGCPGDDKGATPDAAKPDAAGDAAIDGGPCGAERFVTGELVDLDSSTAAFMGVNTAQLTLQGMPSRTDTTSPNGRFELCAPAATSWVFDVAAPGTYLDGIAYIEAEAIGARPLSLRTVTQARAASFYTSRGLTYDDTRAHVLVFLAGDRGSMSIDRAHDAPQAGNDDGMPGTFAWSAGDSGRYVLFPNVVAASPTATLSGDFMGGPHTIPIAAGTLSLVAVAFVSL